MINLFPDGSPAIDGGRGLKRWRQRCRRPAGAGIARHRWRARIETSNPAASAAQASGSPAIDGGRGLKQW